MTITQLEYIIAVDTYRSFAEAARHCHVTQPTLSMQIKKLESELETLLFDRTKKPIITTDIGKAVIAQARTTVLEASRIQEILNTQRDEVKGELRIGIIPTLSPYLLPLFIMNFLEKYPEVNVSVEELVSENIIEKLNSDQLDIGILVTPLEATGIIETPLFYELFVAYVSTGHPLSQASKIDFQDLNVEELWLLTKGHCFRNQVINICGQEQKGTRKSLKLESGSLETLRRIVERQYGYTLLPELATMDMSAEQYQYIRHFKNPQPVREVSLVRRQSYVKAKLVELLQAEILASVPDILKNPNRGKKVKWRD